MMRLLLAAMMGLMVQSAAAKPSSSYGDHLLATTMAKHRDVAGIAISATGKDGKPIAISQGRPAQGHAATATLANTMGEQIGTVSVTFRKAPGDAGAIARFLSRRIYTSDGLAEPSPFVVGTKAAPRAQAIVERMVDTHPRLVTLAMHVAPPGKENIILASNFGRLGKPADDDDRRVIAQGTVIKEVTNGGRRLAVELPQLDATGKVIGALSTSFLISADHDAEAALRDAVALRDEIARATPSLGALVRP